MPVFQLSSRLIFPPAHLAEPQGLLAVGGDLSAERLLLAYRQGIFPWYSEGSPILWWAPDPRLVLEPGHLKVSRSLKKVIRQGRFRVTADRDFEEVMRSCARNPQPERDCTWITGEMFDAYCRLHELGYAHSIECRREGRLVGGLYGVSLGNLFFGESMFHLESNASKVALAALCDRLDEWDFPIIDCQIESPHLQSLGAKDIPREQFLEYVRRSLQEPDRIGSWTSSFNPVIVDRADGTEPKA